MVYILYLFFLFASAAGIFAIIHGSRLLRKIKSARKITKHMDFKQTQTKAMRIVAMGSLIIVMSVSFFGVEIAQMAKSNRVMDAMRLHDQTTQQIRFLKELKDKTEIAQMYINNPVMRSSTQANPALWWDGALHASLIARIGDDDEKWRALIAKIRSLPSLINKADSLNITNYPNLSFSVRIAEKVHLNVLAIKPLSDDQITRYDVFFQLYSLSDELPEQIADNSPPAHLLF